MLFNEWVDNQVLIEDSEWNTLLNDNIRTYLVNKFTQHELLTTEDNFTSFFKSKCVAFKHEINKIKLLETQYDAIFADIEILNPKVESKNTIESLDNNVGYNVDTTFAKSTQTTTDTYTEMNKLNQLDGIYRLITKLYQKIDGLVVGMLNTIKNVGEE